MLKTRSGRNKHINIVGLGSDNLSEHPEVICFINPKHPAYPLKIKWMKKRFRDGLKVKLLYRENEKNV